MHHEAGRLVDDDEVVVLGDDVERDVLRLRLGGLGRRHLDGEDLAGRDLGRAAGDGIAATQHPAFGDQRLQPRAAELEQVVCQHAVEPQPFILRARR